MSEIESVLFDSKYWTPLDAREWLYEHGLYPIKRIHKTGHYLRYRINDPREFQRFRSKKLSKHITAIFGFFK